MHARKILVFEICSNTVYFVQLRYVCRIWYTFFLARYTLHVKCAASVWLGQRGDPIIALKGPPSPAQYDQISPLLCRANFSRAYLVHSTYCTAVYGYSGQSKVHKTRLQRFFLLLVYQYQKRKEDRTRTHAYVQYSAVQDQVVSGETGKADHKRLSSSFDKKRDNLDRGGRKNFYHRGLFGEGDGAYMVSGGAGVMGTFGEGG